MKGRLYLIVSLWLKGDDVAAFEAFERKAAAVMERHGGRIERALRCTGPGDEGGPFEVHLVSFPDEAALRAYRDDEQTQELSALRRDVIARTEIWRGEEVEPYEASGFRTGGSR